MADEPTKVNRILLNVAAFVVIVAGMRAAAPLLVPFLLAIFLTILFATPLRWLAERGVPRVIAALLIVLVILGFGTVVGTVLGTTIVDFTRSIPRYEALLSTRQTALIDWLRGLGFDVSREAFSDYFDPTRLFTLLRTLVTSLTQVLTNGLLILLTMVFALLEVSGFPAKITAAFGESDASLARSNFARVTLNVRRYVALKTLISLGTGVGVAIWLAVLGVDYPLLWGLIAFLLNFIPNIGSFVAAVPAVLLAWLQLGFGSALVAALGYVVVNVLWANIIEPRVMGYGVGLSTLVVFVSLVFWGWVLGPIGMLLSVPLTVIFKIILEMNESTRWLAVLLGSGRSLEPAPVLAGGSPAEKPVEVPSA
ncbi:MAG: AI-2E family transporter [Gemmatimonadota bacterium]